NRQRGHPDAEHEQDGNDPRSNRPRPDDRGEQAGGRQLGGQECPLGRAHVRKLHSSEAPRAGCILPIHERSATTTAWTNKSLGPNWNDRIEKPAPSSSCGACFFDWTGETSGG